MVVLSTLVILLSHVEDHINVLGLRMAVPTQVSYDLMQESAVEMLSIAQSAC